MHQPKTSRMKNNRDSTILWMSLLKIYSIIWVNYQDLLAHKINSEERMIHWLVETNDQGLHQIWKISRKGELWQHIINLEVYMERGILLHKVPTISMVLQHNFKCTKLSIMSTSQMNMDKPFTLLLVILHRLIQLRTWEQSSFIQVAIQAFHQLVLQPCMPNSSYLTTAESKVHIQQEVICMQVSQFRSRHKWTWTIP